ncbi:MAG: hypothetical protein H6598_02040 [Flavobacteriales bacterium]|nr:hypothetical protein [Flavobacteriales bacterium]
MRKVIFFCLMCASGIINAQNNRGVIVPVKGQSETKDESISPSTNGSSTVNNNQASSTKLTSGTKTAPDSGANLPTPEPFEPIPATGYTDPNYQVNVQKSNETEALLRNPDTNNESIDPSIQEYYLERDKYPVNSPEYNLIQEKINNIEGTSGN